MSRLVRQFSSTTQAAIAALDVIESVAEEFGLGDELRERMLMVAGEAVANAAGHGNGFDPTRRVTFILMLTHEDIVMEVHDEGVGLRTAQLADARLPDDPLQAHGRGLYIIRELADRVWVDGGGQRLCAAWARESS